MKKELKSYNQKFKIYGRKRGRKLNKNSNIEILKKYQLNLPIDQITKKIILDIGSGNGENALFLWYFKDAIRNVLFFDVFFFHVRKCKNNRIN